MIKLKCPKCNSELEIEDKEFKGSTVTAVFCFTEDCFFHKNPLVGLVREWREDQEKGVYISEAII